MPKQKRRYHRRAKQEVMTVVGNEPTPVHDTSVLRSDGLSSIAAVTEVLQALTDLPTDRAKARVLRFVQDYFDERHGH